MKSAPDPPPAPSLEDFAPYVPAILESLREAAPIEDLDAPPTQEEIMRLREALLLHSTIVQRIAGGPPPPMPGEHPDLPLRSLVDLYVAHRKFTRHEAILRTARAAVDRSFSSGDESAVLVAAMRSLRFAARRRAVARDLEDAHELALSVRYDLRCALELLDPAMMTSARYARGLQCGYLHVMGATIDDLNETLGRLRHLSPFLPWSEALQLSEAEHDALRERELTIASAMVWQPLKGHH